MLCVRARVRACVQGVCSFVHGRVGAWGGVAHPALAPSPHTRCLTLPAPTPTGGPIYVSDRPGHHDFELLRRLVLADGTGERVLLLRGWVGGWGGGRGEGVLVARVGEVWGLIDVAMWGWLGA